MAKKHKNAPKLNTEQKEWILNKLALRNRGGGQVELAKEFKVEFGIEVSHVCIDHYYPEAKKRRAELNKTIADIEPYADKVIRVQELGRLVRDILEKENGLWYIVETKYGSYEKGNHLQVKELLEAIKAEMEPFKIAPTNPDGTNEYSGFTTDEGRMERLIELCNSIRERVSTKSGK